MKPMNNREAERSARGGSTRIEGFLRLWGRRLLVNVGIQAAAAAARLSAARPCVTSSHTGPAACNATAFRRALSRTREASNPNDWLRTRLVAPEFHCGVPR